MGISSLTARNVARDPNRQQSGRTRSDPNVSSTTTLSRITPNLVAILQQNRMISRNTAVLPGMARDIGAMRQGITKLAKVQDIKSTAGADSFNVEAKSLEESYEARMARRPSKVSATGAAPVLKDASIGFFDNLLDLFGKGVKTLFSNKGIIATGILAALFPKQAIDIMEGLFSGMKMLGLVVLKVANGMAKFALWLSETFDMDMGDMLVGAGGAYLAKGAAGVAGAAATKFTYDKLKPGGRTKTPTGVNVDLDEGRARARADDVFKKPFMERVKYWLTTKQAQNIIGKKLLQRLGAAAIASATGIGAFVGILIAAGSTAWAAYEIITAFLEWDEGAGGHDTKEQKSAEAQLTAKQQEEEKEKLKKVEFQKSLSDIITNTNNAATALDKLEFKRPAVEQFFGVGAPATPAPAPAAPTPTQAPAAAPAAPTRISKIDHIRERLTKELKLDDMDANAIIANLMQESRLDPEAVNVNSKAVGIAQWLDSNVPRRTQFYKFAGLTPEKISGLKTVEDHKKALKSIPFDKQIDFMVAELKDTIPYGTGTHSQVLRRMKSKTNLQDKITAFEAGYENSGSGKGSSYVGADMDKRYQYGANVSGTKVGEFSPKPGEIPMMNAPAQPVVVVQNNNNAPAAPAAQAPIPAILTGIGDSEFMKLLLRRAGTPNLAH